MLLDSLAGALAVVTGGARGIGRGIARTLLGEGAAWLLREQSSYVTGAVLPVDGGQSVVLSMPISIELGEEAR